MSQNILISWGIESLLSKLLFLQSISAPNPFNRFFLVPWCSSIHAHINCYGYHCQSENDKHPPKYFLISIHIICYQLSVIRIGYKKFRLKLMNKPQ